MAGLEENAQGYRELDHELEETYQELQETIAEQKAEMGASMYKNLVGLLDKFKNLKVFRKEFKKDAREKQKEIEVERQKLIAQFPEFDEEAF